MTGLMKNQWLVMYDKFHFVNYSYFNFNRNRCSLVYFKNSKGKVMVKLFYKKDYENALKKIVELQKCNETLEVNIKILKEKTSILRKNLTKFQNNLIEANAKNSDIEMKLEEFSNEALEKEQNLKNVQQDLVKANAKNSDYELALAKLKESNRILASSKGGFKKSIKNQQEKIKLLEETISTLNKEISNLKSDRYLVKKVPSGRTPKSQEMKSKHSVTTKSNVSKFIKEEHLSL